MSAITNQLASASSSSSSGSSPRWTYDVFLSFRGKDTRKTFVDHLYFALHQKGIHTFKDDQKLRTGKSISPQLLNAIEESRFAIVVFSENYARSSWCLDELVKIVDCYRRMGQTVFPVFYDVDPSDVRRSQGSRQMSKFGQGFAGAIARLNGDDSSKKAKVWEEALVEVANFSGWDLRNTADG